MKYFFLTIMLIWFSDLIGQPSKDDLGKLKKKALIIGVSKYSYAKPLSNPVNDAKDLGVELKMLDFDTTICLNANRNTLRNKIKSWGNEIKTDCDIALFYFAGHGAQVSGENYIFPTDGNSISTTELKNTTFRMSDVQSILNESTAKLNIIILDACRDDEGLMSIRHTRFSNGLAPMSPKGNGTLICYSTEAGKTSSDGLPNTHSEYTQVLLQYIGIPNLPILSIMERVHDEVFNKRELDQNPCIYSSVGSKFNYCFSVRDDGIHKSAVNVETALLDSFRNTQITGSNSDKEQMFAGIIVKFDSVLNAATQAVIDSLKYPNSGFGSSGSGADYEKFSYQTSRGLLTKFSGKQTVWVSFDLELIGASIQIKLISDNARYVGADDPLKRYEDNHNLLSSDSLHYSAYAINWQELADHIKRYFFARAPVIKR